MSRTPALALLAAGLLAFAQPAAADPAGEVTLKAAKLVDLENYVKAQKGKVVVLDVWADWCIPCKKAFPGLVKLHEKYAKDGLVAVSVSLDTDKGHARALKFLKTQNAAFANFRLDEAEETWQKYWKIGGPPAIFVFDREGRPAGRFDSETPGKTHGYEDDIEPAVKQLLGK